MSQNKEVTFKKNENGSWRLFLDDKDLDVSFFIPDGCVIEDYNIKVLPGPDIYQNICPYKDVVFRLLKRPSEMGPDSIVIGENGGLAFEKGLIVDVRDELWIKDNQNSTIVSTAPIETNDFTCVGNKDSIFTISDFDKEKLVIDKVKITVNVDAKIDLTWRPTDINISRNAIKGVKDHKGITLGGESVNFEGNDINMKSSESKLVIDGENISSRDCIYNVSGTLRIKLGSMVKDENKKAQITLINGNIISEDSVNSELECSGQSLEIESTLKINGINLLVAEDVVWLKGRNTIEDSKVFASDASLKIVDAFIKKSKLSFDKPLEEGEIYNMIDKASVDYCDIDKINGTLRGQIERVYGDGLNLANNSSLETTKVFSRSDDKIERDFLEINNLSLKEDSKLKVCLPVSQGEKPKGVAIKNTIVSGNSEIYSDGNMEIKNCELNETKITQKGQEIDTKCSNNAFKGEVTLSNIESLSCSVLENSYIASANKHGLKVESEYLKNVSDYQDYLASKEARAFIDGANNKPFETL